jgi:hypothetical protein
MSPVLTAPVEAPPAPPERPGFFAVAWATFLGYLLTVLVAFPVLACVVLAGLPVLDLGDSVERGRRPDLGDGRRAATLADWMGGPVRSHPS